VPIDEDVVGALAPGGTGDELLSRVARGPVLERDDQIQLAYVPFTAVRDWKAAAGGLRSRRVADADHALVLEVQSIRSRRVAALAIVPQPGIRLTAIVGVGRRSDYGDAYEYLSGRLHPRVMRPYFRQHDFATMMREIDRHLGRTAEIHFTRLGHQRRLTKEKRESSLTWTDVRYQDVLNEAREKGHFFKHVSFEVRLKGNATDVKGAMARPNIMSLSASAAVRLAGLVNERLVRHAAEEHKLVTDRSRTEALTRPRPIVATFEDALISKKGDAQQVTERFFQYKRSSIAVIHGNPYVHVRIIDLDDGSSYAVFMTSADAMTLIPQLRSSESSFSRLLEFVHDSFGAVKFEDAPKVYA